MWTSWHAWGPHGQDRLRCADFRVWALPSRLPPKAKPLICVLDHRQAPQGSGLTLDTSSLSDCGPRPSGWYQALAKHQQKNEGAAGCCPPPVLPLSYSEKLGLPLNCTAARGRKRRPDRSSLKGLVVSTSLLNTSTRSSSLTEDWEHWSRRFKAQVCSIMPGLHVWLTRHGSFQSALSATW